MSPASTTDPDWWAGLGSLLRSHPGVAERLIVEITESAAIQDIDETRGFVARVKDLGCRIAIDDFGAGYTSFRNLRKLGVDIVKIDGAFVQHIMRSEDDRAFVRTLIDLAKRLNLKTVAEWVQDEQAAAMLRVLGLRLPAGRADRSGLDRPAAGCRGLARGDLKSRTDSRSRRPDRCRATSAGFRFSVSRSTFLLHFVELALEIVDLAGLAAAISSGSRRRFAALCASRRANGANIAKARSNISMLRRT